MANTYKNIVITPNIGSNTADPRIVFSGANNTVNTDITLSVNPSTNGTLSIDGDRQLFSVTNSMVGIHFSVNDANGIPNIEITDSGIIRLAQYSGNVQILGGEASTSNTTGELQVTGGVGVSGNVYSNAIYTNGLYYAANGLPISTGGGGSAASGYSNNMVVVANTSGYVSNTSNLFYYAANNTLVSSNVTVNRIVANTINEITSAPAISAGVLTLNLNNGPVFNVALNAAITTITLTNVSSANTVSSFILIFTADGTLRSVAWPASFSWPNGITPAITPTLNKKDVYTFFTIDGGTRWNAFITGQAL